MKVEVDVLGSLSLIILVVSVDVKHHERRRSHDASHAFCPDLDFGPC